MKVNLVKKEADYLEVELEGEEYGFANMIKDKLFENGKVEFASCMLEHPTLGHPRIIVKTKGEKPEKALLKAVQSAEKDIASFKEAFKKAGKKK